MVSGFCNKKLAKILPKDFVMANPDKEMSICFLTPRPDHES